MVRGTGKSESIALINYKKERTFLWQKEADFRAECRET